MSSDVSEERDRIIYQYVNRYCADTLTTIRIYGGVKLINDCFPKPFKSVDTVKIGGPDLRDQWANFQRWFPNLRKIQMDDFSVDKTPIAAVSFPHLQALRLYLYENVLTRQLTMSIAVTESVVKLLHANRQLRELSFTLNVELTFQQLMDMIKEHKSITKLVLRDRFICENVDELNQFADEHPLIEELNFFRSKFNEDGAVTLARRLNSMKRFLFNIKNPGHDKFNCFLSKFDQKWQHSNSSEDNEIILVELLK